MRKQNTISRFACVFGFALTGGLASSLALCAPTDSGVKNATGDNASAEKQTGGNSQGPVSLTVDGISVQADDDAPRVLNILPWQRPTISKRTRSPLPLDAPALLEPVQPEALRRHRTFRSTLDPLAE